MAPIEGGVFDRASSLRCPVGRTFRPIPSGFPPRLIGGWRETDAESADRETLIRDLVEGQYFHPVRIVAFNTAEGWSRDVTVDISDELRRRYIEFGKVPESVLDFLDANRR
jgi:hypothetical protein